MEDKPKKMKSFMDMYRKKFKAMREDKDEEKNPEEKKKDPLKVALELRKKAREES